MGTSGRPSWQLRGIGHGYRVGFSSSQSRLRSSHSNLVSATQHPRVVSDYLERELELGHTIIVGTPEQARVIGIHVSPLGDIPKKARVGQWHMIMDLSSQGHSVNNGISRELCSLHYTSVDEAAKWVATLGAGAQLAKMDIRQAYRNIPVAPADRRLLGFQWKGTVYLDQVLPFGLRSAPLIFSAITDALLWIMLKRGVSWAIHYIDDFLTIGPPHTEETGTNMQLMEDICQHAGLLIEPAKSVGPVTSITFLGIEIDSVKRAPAPPG